MAKVLNSISLDSPASPVTASVDDTFAFEGTPSFSGGGGVQRYDWKWEVDDGGGYVTIASSGTGLITSDTNPVVNSNSQSQNSITVSCEQAGSYTIRMAGAPTSGGAYTVLSATQTVSVEEQAGTDELTATSIAAGTPTLNSPALGQAHVLTATGLETGAVTVGSPAVGQTHVLSGTSLSAGGPTLDEPALGGAPVVLTPIPLYTGPPALVSPGFGQVHVLAASAVVVGNPSMGSPGLNRAQKTQKRAVRSPLSKRRKYTLLTKEEYEKGLEDVA